MSTESGLNKILALQFLYENISQVIFVGAPMLPGFCPACLSPQDVGVWANAIYHFGLVPSLILFGALALILVRRWEITYIPLLAILLLWKAQFYDPFLWIIVGHILKQRAGYRRARLSLRDSLALYARHAARGARWPMGGAGGAR